MMTPIICNRHGDCSVSEQCSVTWMHKYIIDASYRSHITIKANGSCATITVMGCSHKAHSPHRPEKWKRRERQYRQIFNQYSHRRHLTGIYCPRVDTVRCGLIKSDVCHQLIKKKKDTKVQSVVITFDVLKGWRQKGSFIPKQQPTVQRVLSTGCSAVSELNQAITFMAPQTHSCNFSRFDYVAGFSCFSSGLFLKCQPTLMCHAPETETKYCWIKKCTVRKVPSSLIISCWRRLFKK